MLTVQFVTFVSKIRLSHYDDPSFVDRHSDTLIPIELLSEVCPAGSNRSSNTISVPGSGFCTPCDLGTVANRNKTECGE